ncbi:amino acid permease-domain-containing protein [Coniella lustricola]|uniref:Amino acid permease-domain-containing protein n=1 Tax=Coniella lustricola TaxID=2025994 RepID=A0A2T3AA88_9PEZI|nr:amino acid permease-domain-containing protein [Coniella lustricola]
MAPPALDLHNISYKSINAFSTATTPLRSPCVLSCRSPITPSSGNRPLTSHTRSGSCLGPPTQHTYPSARSPILQRFERDGQAINGRNDDDDDCNDDNDDDDDDSSDEEIITDSTWFLPHSPGLPRPRPLRSVDDGKLGTLSAINIIVGKTMGVGAYSIPSAIFSGVGSVGMTLLLWVVGSLISFCGLAVYLDLGTAMPRSGGERVYLERIFKKPYMLATCMFMSYAVLLGFSTPNAIVLGEHALYVAGIPENQWNVRAIAFLAVSLLCYIQARHTRLGLSLINILGFAKILILVIVIVSGVAGGIIGVGTTSGETSDAANSQAAATHTSTAQRNFHAIWDGSSTQPYDYATALLKVIYCFRGYSTANQVLSDVRNPVRTLKTAAPIALFLVSVAYLAINIAFFLVVDKDELRSAGVLAAGVFFRKIFGDGLGAHVLPLFVVVTAAGNIAATSFAQARVNEELAREGILPSFWLTGARNGSPPIRGLALHWLVSSAAIIFPPPGKIYNFLVDIGGYPVSVISVAVALASNCLLLILPWIPPTSTAQDAATAAAFPSWAYPATSLGVLGLGALYWVGWRLWGPGDPRVMEKGVASAWSDAGVDS